MADKKTRPPARPETTRDKRLKAALKANLGRRKQQARARSASEGDQTGKNKG